MITMNKEPEKWFVIVLLFIILIAIITTRLLHTPAVGRADNTRIYEQQRDLSTPSSRLVGHWIGVPEGDKLYYQLIDHSFEYGIFTWILKSNIVAKYKIISESPSGEQLKTREFFLLDNCMERATVEYFVSKDGLSMTKKMFYEDGTHELFNYRYVDGSTHP
jgi:hypothetical protein